MLGWGIVLGGVILGAAVLGLANYYGPFASKFVEVRYRVINDTDHVGPVLEIGWTLLNGVAIAALALIAFPDATEAFVGQLTSVGALIVGAVIAAAVIYHCTGPAIKESDLLLRNQGPVWDQLPQDTRERLRVLKRDPATRHANRLRAVRINYIPYCPYSIINYYLAATIAWIVGTGLWDDLERAFSARNDMAADVPGPVASVGAATAEMELYFGAFRDYHSAMLDLALDLTAVLAFALLFAFWILGTPFQLLYTVNAVAAIRWVMSIALLLLLPAFILASYLHLVWVSQEVSDTLRNVTVQVAAAQPGGDELVAFHDVADRIQERSDVQTFWAKLLGSTGGVLLLAGIGFSFWQNRRGKESFFKQLLPRRLQRTDPDTSKVSKWLDTVFSPPSRNGSD